MDTIEKMKAYLRRMSFPEVVLNELNLDNMSEDAVKALGTYMVRRERESAYMHGVTQNALARYKKIRAQDESEEDGEYDVRIFGTIVSDSDKESSSVEADLVSPGDVQDQIDKIPEGQKDVRVIINSPGGNFFAASAMIDMFKDLDANITVRVRSMAASAASYIALSINDSMEMAPGSLFMVHYGMINGWNRADMAKASTTLEKVDEYMVDALVGSSVMSKEDAEEYLAEETFFNDKEAYDLGISTSPPEASTKRKRKDSKVKSELNEGLGQPGPSQKLDERGLKATMRSRLLFYSAITSKQGGI